MAETESSPSQPRVKRQRLDKVGRFAALEKLKSLKGQKNKYELKGEVDNVYDIVDEKEFSKQVHEKYGDDWIEDDGTGYVEDGRDIFEDENNEYSSDDPNNKNKSKSRKRQRRDKNEDESKKGNVTIRRLFNNAVPKKKKAYVKGEGVLDQDNVLADILAELDENKKPQDNPNKSSSKENCEEISRKPNKNEKETTKEYLQNFFNSMKKKETSTSKNESSDEEIIDRLLQPKSKNDKDQHCLANKSTAANDKPEIEIDNIKKVDDILEEQNTHEENKTSDDKKIADEFENMDLSVLDETENQFDFEKKPIMNNVMDENVHLLSNWENICKMNNFEEKITATEINAIPEWDSEQTNALRFWYWDAWEESNIKPGRIFLFGKIVEKNDFKSICVQIENIDRVLYLLPRKYMLDPITKEPTKTEVTFLDVYNEFMNTISTELEIKEFRSRKVTKKFAFHLPGVDVPQECEYMEVSYAGSKPIPDIRRKYSSIAHIFGTNSTAVETFLINKKIKGPCWLDVKHYKKVQNPLSWCKMEIQISSDKNITIAEHIPVHDSIPPMCVLTINVQTVLNPKSQKNEIFMISCLANTKFLVDKPPPSPPFNQHFCGFTRPSNVGWPLRLDEKLKTCKTKITKLDSERALISWFLAVYQTIDADLIVTHDAYDCQLDIICDRIATLKVPLWSRIGRLRVTKVFGKRVKDFFIGRMICDVKTSAEELIKSRSYDLSTLCSNVLKVKEGERMEFSDSDIYSMYENSDGLVKLITLTMHDTLYILRLMCELNVLPLALQITNICGNLMSRTLEGGRSERNEYLLLHAFTEKDYIVPDRSKNRRGAFNADNSETTVSNQNTSAGSRKKAAYSGGLVLEPKKGFYDKYILLMDFNSLYPSIIQEYNICFTTINEPNVEGEIPTVPDSSTTPGILPTQIRRLVERRREVKKLMANPDLSPDLKLQYNIRQLALKLTANSMYGCLGFSNSRFHAQHLAALVTFKGREILMNTKSLVEKLDYEVIYGDTDSLMINTNCIDYDQVFKIGHSIKQTVNRIYKQIELDIDGVFKPLLLLKKKKYAAVTVTRNKKSEFTYSQEHKGLDIVRRDWSQISVEIGKAILNEILKLDNQLDEKIENIHSILEKCKEEILNNSVPLSLLIIRKQLTKSPKDYTTINTLPHVQVALRMNKTANKRYKKGDVMEYIICEDATGNPAMQRGYHIEELKSNENLKIDTNYYLSQQIHPVVSRICEPLEGTNASRIAESLGLDPKKFKIAAQKVQREKMEQDIGVSINKSALQRFRYCEKFKFICVTCKTENLVASAFKPVDGNHIPVLERCSNMECKSPPYTYPLAIKNQLIMSIRACIRRFYENWLVCDDPTCNFNTRAYSHVTFHNRPICSLCKQGVLIRQYSERDLYTQLSYFQYMFDLEHNEKKNLSIQPELESCYLLLKETAEQFLQKSGYFRINLENIFSKLKPSYAGQLVNKY